MATHENTTPDHVHAAFEGDLAKSYNSRTGGCNILLADHLISLITPHLPPATLPLRILDNACGPAVLTTQCLKNHAISSHSALHISAVDLSADFISANRALIASHPEWTSNGVTVDTEIMNGIDLKFPDNTFDVSFTSLALFAFPDPVKGASELHRTLKPNGIAALTTWKNPGWLSLLHEVERRLRPGQEPTRFPSLETWSVPGKLTQTLREGGFQEVEEGEIRAYAFWENLEVAAENISETLRMMVGKGWSEEEKEKMGQGFEEVMREGWGEVIMGKGGRVGFEMVAWTGVGRK